MSGRRDRRFSRVMFEFERNKVRAERLKRAFNSKKPRGASLGLRDLICLCITKGQLDWTAYISENFKNLAETLREPDVASEGPKHLAPHAREREIARRLDALGRHVSRALIEEATVDTELWSENDVDDVISSALEIVVTTLGMSNARQIEAAEKILTRTTDYLRKVREGRVHIHGREPGYFQRQTEVRRRGPEPEHIQAYIRLTAFKPEELWGKSWFDTVYQEYIEDVEAGLLTVDYIFLLHSLPADPLELEFVARYEIFASTISVLAATDDRLSADLVIPSIALLTNRRVAFTHDRGPGGILTDNDEWLFEKDYERLKKKYDELSMLSARIFAKVGPQKSNETHQNQNS